METHTLAVLPVPPDFGRSLDEREQKMVSHGVHCPSLQMECSPAGKNMLVPIQCPTAMFEEATLRWP